MEKEIKYIKDLNEIENTVFLYKGKKYKINVTELLKLITERER